MSSYSWLGRMRGGAEAGIAFVALGLGLALPGAGRGDDGALDTAFQGDGKWSFVDDTSNRAVAAGVDSQGRLVIAYTHQFSGDDHDFRVHRVPDAGAPTVCGGAAFDLGGTDDDRVAAMVVQPDDMAVLVGHAATGASPAVAPALARIDLGTCSPDTTFSGDGEATLSLPFEARLTAVALAPDGKIVVAGVRVVNGTDEDFFIARLNPNGTPDLPFGLDGATRVFFDLGPTTDFDRASAVAVQPDGKIVVGGTVDGPSGNTDFGVARLTTGGGLDSTFGTLGKVRIAVDFGGSNFDDLNALALLPGGRIVLAGEVGAATGTRVGLAMLLPNGTPASDFGPGGQAVFRYSVTTDANLALALAVQGDKKLLVAGAAGPAGLLSDTDFALARISLAPSAGLDPTFGNGGAVIVPFDLGGLDIDWAAGLTLGQAGRITAAGVAGTESTSISALAALRLDNAYVFADGFESATTAAWSAVSP